MSLENLARIGKLKPLAADEREIRRLLESAERAVRDAAHEELSTDTRFTLAYGALLQVALAALRAKGYRPATSEPGHRGAGVPGGCPPPDGRVRKIGL